ncbi:helix-turn-helix domain-containing protein [Streptomyces sp. SHP 1-2]|uniref:helix-turn-helix domain-containing protein n=1 Tax=Streptomyces sp. SHP 1-2 TaxID=2769489 RepID=UPI0022377A86|nr:helix-turn-helix transcriptional regulator [Streptomyces sp. SHP 1-2]MCW5249094.1 helix-turn-helix transcriptional regulator [Streptomyces sp. SHP 1-2]
MVNRKTLSPESSPAAAYGARVRKSREDQSWTQDELAARVAYSSQHISAIETARKPPTLPFSRKLDQVFSFSNSADSFEQEWRDMRHGSLLEGFPEYVAHEGRAAEIRLYEVGVIPGLLQTPEYAATLEADAVRRGAITAAQARERVDLVLRRQATLSRPTAPQLFAVLDEGCIRRPMGTADVMNAQYERLLEFARMPNTVLQVAPFSMGARRPFSLPVTVLTMPDRSLMSYAESSQRGHLERESAFVLPTLAAYHQLQAEAPSQADSVAMIERARKGMF